VDYPLLDIFLSTMWFFLWFLWIFLLVRVFLDLFRDAALNGWAKAGWAVVLIVLPYLGVLIYMIARGKGMAERQVQETQAHDAEFREYVRSAAQGVSSGAPGTPGTAEELGRLAELRTSGVLTEEEFQQAKSRLLAA
jgi:hypothetical protein